MRDNLKIQLPFYKIYNTKNIFVCSQSQSFCTNTKALFLKSYAFETYRHRQENKQGGDLKSIDFKKGPLINLVKPCLDLRRIRRGRVYYQVPRVLSRERRRLSGIRRICKLLGTTSRKSFAFAMHQKKTTSLKTERSESRYWKEFPLFFFCKNHIDVSQVKLVERKALFLERYSRAHFLRDQVKPKTKFLIHNKVSETADKNTNSLNSKALLDKKSTLFSQQVKQHSKKLGTKVMRMRMYKGNFSDRLSYSLGSEIKACAKSADEKKRIYRTASLNRAFISLSW